MMTNLPNLLGYIFGIGLLLMLFSIVATGNFDIFIPFANEIFMGFLAKVFLAFIGVIGIRLVLYWFDQLCGLNFKQWFTNVDDNHKAIYLSIRFFAVSLFFALILI